MLCPQSLYVYLITGEISYEKLLFSAGKSSFFTLHMNEPLNNANKIENKLIQSIESNRK